MKIEIKGRIVSDDHIEVYQWFGYAATSPSVVKNAIAEAEASGDKELLVEINSGGGSVFAGAEIYYALKKFNGTVNVEIPSLAASAASFIAMAGHKVSMSIMGQMMIHGASTYAGGNHQTMSDTGDFLRSIDDSIINAYLTKTSKTRDELRAMMDKDTWMNAQQALENGLIDEILFENHQPDAVASIKNSDDNELLPEEIINKVKAEILAGKTNDVPNPVNVAEPNNTTKEDSGMNLEKLKNEHPDLVKQVQDEAVQNERKRIQEIENIAQPGTEAIVNKAKFDTGITAAETAMEILKAQKEQTQTQLQNRIADAQPLNQIETGEASANNNSNTTVDNLLDKIFG